VIIEGKISKIKVLKAKPRFGFCPFLPSLLPSTTVRSFLSYGHRNKVAECSGSVQLIREFAYALNSSSSKSRFIHRKKITVYLFYTAKEEKSQRKIPIKINHEYKMCSPF
jgi:hypothetical protein